MDNNLQDKFDKMVDAFTKLDLNTMKKEIIKGQKQVLSDIMMINSKINRTHEPLLNKELIDLNNIPISEKDFLEGIFVFTKSIDESLKDLLNNINNDNV